MSCTVCFDLGVSSATDYEYKFWGLNGGTFTLCESESCDRRLAFQQEIFLLVRAGILIFIPGIKGGIHLVKHKKVCL